MPRLPLLLVSLSAVLLSACVVAPYPPQRVVYSQPVPAPLPPPQVRYEPVPQPQPQPQPVPQTYPQTYPQSQPVPSYQAEGPVIVDMAPPAPLVEVVPAVPYPGALWIGGYWGWNGGRHQWVPGRWEHARPGYGWNPHAWVNVGGRWHLQAGGWVRR